MRHHLFRATVFIFVNLVELSASGLDLIVNGFEDARVMTLGETVDVLLRVVETVTILRRAEVVVRLLVEMQVGIAETEIIAGREVEVLIFLRELEIVGTELLIDRSEH